MRQQISEDEKKPTLLKVQINGFYKSAPFLESLTSSSRIKFPSFPRFILSIKFCSHVRTNPTDTGCQWLKFWDFYFREDSRQIAFRAYPWYSQGRENSCSRQATYFLHGQSQVCIPIPIWPQTPRRSCPRCERQTSNKLMFENTNPLATSPIFINVTESRRSL